MPTFLPGGLPHFIGWPGERKASKYATKSAQVKENGVLGSSGVQQYDYVIVGGGTAGAVLANRLTEDPNVTVLVLEAGYSDSRQLFSRIPAAFAFTFQTECDWDYSTVPQEHLNGRKLYWPRGKMLGGSSAMNALIYQRCAPYSYDRWGVEGWAYKDLLPYFNKSEGFQSGDHFNPDIERKNHGYSGPWKTQVSAQFMEVSTAAIQTAEKFGLEFNQDINTKDKSNCGITRLQTFIDERGRRSSTSQAYLTPEVRRRSNLIVGVGVTVTNLIYAAHGEKDELKVIGVEFAQSATAPKWTVHAKREVLLCGGAVNTPQLLMISGIGPRSHLESRSIEVKKDMPAVGQHMKDHLTTGLFWYLAPGSKSYEWLKRESRIGLALLNWAIFGKGPMTSNLAECAVFLRHQDFKQAEEPELESIPKETPDVEFLVAPVAYPDHALISTPHRDSASIGCVHLNPSSEGFIELAGPTVFDKPLIDPRYLSTQQDRDAFLSLPRMLMRLTEQSPLKEHLKDQFDFKGVAGFEEFIGYPDYQDCDDEQLKKLMTRVAFTLYHPMCSTRMGNKDDGTCVVDPQLKVYGVQGLRVIDAGIFPNATLGHPCAAVVAVAEKAADIIKGRDRQADSHARVSDASSMEKPQAARL